MNDHTNTEGQTVPMPGPDGQGEGKKPGLPKPPLFTSDYIAMAEILQFAMERFGQLVLALMYYTTDGTMPDDLPPDLKIMFGIYQRKVDAAREKYENKCAANAKNGAKGGKAKAENARKKPDGIKFSPPTQKQFREAVQHFAAEGDIPNSTSDYDADSFFDELRESGWIINSVPLQTRRDWESAIRARFYCFDGPLPNHFYYMIFSAAFAATRDSDWADAVAYDLMDSYDASSKSWVVEGEQFKSWKDALILFAKKHSESSDT